MVPNPVLYEAVARERQARFRSRPTAGRRDGSARGMRVRIGRLLISAGTTISGDSIELRPRRSARRPHVA
jgi:hypothetical protein